MGNPEADSSNFQKDQADYDVQIQYNVQVSCDENSNNPAYYDPNPQSDQSYQPLQSGDNNDPNPQYQQNDAVNNQLQQQQQQFQPPPPQQQQQQFQPPPPQQQQQHFQPPQQQQQQFQPRQQQFGSAQNAPSLPPQLNQPYSVAPPPQSVAQFPNPAYAKEGAYPPQQQPSYPPMAAAPQGYPPQQQPQYSQQSAPQTYPPNSPLPMPYPPPPGYQQQPAAQPVPQPVPFPPPAGDAQYATMQPSPINPGVQGYGAAQGIPMQPNMMGSNTEGWRTGLFDCMDDPMNAVITFFFPCLTFGQVAEIIDNGTTTCVTGGLMYALISAFIGMPCIYSCTYRSKLRSKFGLVESPAPDWIVHFLCEPCALCQEYRELNRRGWDPSIGWLGNLQKQQQMQQQPQVAMKPPMNQTMMA